MDTCIQITIASRTKCYGSAQHARCLSLVQRWCREYFGGSNSGARLLVTEANGGELLPKAGPAHPLPPSSALFCSACSNVLLISPPSSNICNGTSPYLQKKPFPQKNFCLALIILKTFPAIVAMPSDHQSFAPNFHIWQI